MTELDQIVAEAHEQWLAELRAEFNQSEAERWSEFMSSDEIVQLWKESEQAAWEDELEASEADWQDELTRIVAEYQAEHAGQ